MQFCLISCSTVNIQQCLSAEISIWDQHALVQCDSSLIGRYLTHPVKILLQRLMFLRCHAVIRCLSDSRRSIWNVWTSVCKLISGLSMPAVGVVHCDAQGSHSLCLSTKYIKIINGYECHSYNIDRVFPSILRREQSQIRFAQTCFDPLWLLAISCNTP